MSHLLSRVLPVLFALPLSAQFVPGFELVPVRLPPAGVNATTILGTFAPPGTLPLNQGFPSGPFWVGAQLQVSGQGAATFDPVANSVLMTDGFTVARQVLTYPGSPLAPTAFPAAVLAALGGPVTGLAVRRATNRWWLASSTGVVAEFDPVAFQLVGSPHAIAGVANVVDLEVRNGGLILVDVNGTWHELDTTAWTVLASHAPVVVLTVPVEDAAVAGNDVFVLLSNRALRSLTHAVPNFGTSQSGATVLAMHASPVIRTFVNCGFPNVQMRALGPSTAGSASFGFRAQNLAPGTLTVLGLADGFSLPGFPLGLGCNVSLTGNLFLLAGVADATGSVAFPFPLLVPYIPNVQLSAQMVTFGASQLEIHPPMGWALWESP